MRRKPELLILAGLLLGAMAFVLWYVVDRRAKLRTTQATAVSPSTPGPGPVSSTAPTTPSPTAPAASSPTATTAPASTPPVAVAPRPTEPVDLAKHDGQTVDFSSGQPLVKNSAEDKAAIDAAMKDIASAEKETTFEAPKKEPTPHK